MKRLITTQQEGAMMLNQGSYPYGKDFTVHKPESRGIPSLPDYAVKDGSQER